MAAKKIKKVKKKVKNPLGDSMQGAQMTEQKVGEQKISLSKIRNRLGKEAAMIFEGLARNYEMLNGKLTNLMTAMRDHFHTQSRDMIDQSHKNELIYKLIDITDRKLVAHVEALKGIGVINPDMAEAYEELFSEYMEMCRIVALDSSVNADVKATRYNFFNE